MYTHFNSILPTYSICFLNNACFFSFIYTGRKKKWEIESCKIFFKNRRKKKISQKNAKKRSKFKACLTKRQPGRANDLLPTCTQFHRLELVGFKIERSKSNRTAGQFIFITQFCQQGFSHSLERIVQDFKWEQCRPHVSKVEQWRKLDKWK